VALAWNQFRPPPSHPDRAGTDTEVSNVNDEQLLAELAPTAEALVERHIQQAKEWFPHEIVPWERGPSVQPDRAWDPDESTIDERVRSAVIVNVLTEDNLPYYFRDIERMFGRTSIWGEWVRRWTAEEGRHSIALRDYLVLSRSVCPVELERGRMAQIMAGEVPEPPDATHGFIYLTLQELATRIAHLNTGRLVDDDMGYQVMKRVAADENHHYLFYRDIASAAIEADSSAAMIAIEHEVRNFEMPGTGIPDFIRHARAIRAAGIYDYVAHHDQILVPVVLRWWAIESLTGLSDEAEHARDRVIEYIARVGRVARRSAEQAEAAGNKRSAVTT